MPVDTTAPVKNPDLFFVGGEWIKPDSPSTFKVIQPATEELFLEAAEANETDVGRAVAAARQAFDKGPWPRMSPAERATYLRALGEAVKARRADFALIHTCETGILHADALLTPAPMGDVFNYYASLADEFEFVERHQPTAGGAVGLLVREPVGVVAAIIPWNGPLFIMAYKLAPALLAGCTVVVKASPEAPGAPYVLAELAEQIGLPPGVLNVVTADREVSELLVRDPRIDKVAFTGSSAAGRRIASLCGERIARYTLELGGKSAAVILDDYDLQAVADSISLSARALTGQVCASITRLVVTESRHDDFLDALATSFAKVRVGDPFDPSVDMGPLAMKRQMDRVEHYIAKGKEEGATLATGGGRPAGLDRGFFIEPTVFGNVDRSATIAQEEIFGPVLSVLPARDERHAVEIANDSIYGLNASVFTNDVDRALAVARELRSGTVGHNGFRSDFGIAFGGFKQSGVGREGGREGLLPYLEAKTVILDAEPSSLDRREPLP